MRHGVKLASTLVSSSRPASAARGTDPPRSPFKSRRYQAIQVSSPSATQARRSARCRTVTLCCKAGRMRSLSPFLMFCGDQHGNAEEAIQLYTSLFEGSRVVSIDRYGPGESEPEGTVRVA